MEESEFEVLLTALREEPEEFAVAILERTTIDTSKVLANGDSLLRIAALRGQLNCVQLLLKNPKANPGDALQGAVAYGHVSCLDALLKDSRTNPNHCRVWTPLFFAACKGYTECLKLLLNHPEIDPNQGRHDSHSPLHEAVRGLKVECVAMLSAHPRINPNKVCSDGYSPLHEACTPKYDDDYETRAKRRKILLLLLSHGAIDVNIHTTMPYILVNYTPLCVAVHWKYYEAVELLLEDERVSLEDAHKDVLRDIKFFGTAVDPGSLLIFEAIEAAQRKRDCWRRRRSWISACLVFS